MPVNSERFERRIKEIGLGYKIGNLRIFFKKSKIRRSFIVCCIKGGLNTTQQILDAYTWALNNNYIEKYNYVNIHYEDFSKKISEKFRTIFHSNWKIKSKKEHFLIIDSKYKIIFDTATPINYGNFNFINKII